MPNVAPKDIAVTRIDSTTVNITWKSMTLEGARGFITAYIITYDTIEGRRRREATKVEVTPETKYKVIGSLDPRQSYVVTVSAATKEGEGVRSNINGKSIIPIWKKPFACIIMWIYFQFQQVLAVPYKFVYLVFLTALSGG